MGADKFRVTCARPFCLHSAFVSFAVAGVEDQAPSCRIGATTGPPGWDGTIEVSFGHSLVTTRAAVGRLGGPVSFGASRVRTIWKSRSVSGLRGRASFGN